MPSETETRREVDEPLSEKDAKCIVVLTAVYNDWEAVLSLIPKIDRQIGKITSANAEVVIVDDGSFEPCPYDSFRDLTLKHIKQIDMISLTRNLGNQRAIATGIGYVDRYKPNNYVIVMDADHEDNPDYIPVFHSECKLRDDKAVVFAERTKRSEGLSFLIFYNLYRIFYRIVTGQNIKFGNFCMIPAAIAHRVANLPELWNHFAAAVIKSRLPIALVPTVRGTRISGQSDMKFLSLVAHAFNGLTVFAEAAAVRLIVFSTALAIIVAVAGSALIGIRLFTSWVMMGWTSTMLTLLGIILAQMLTTVVLVLFIVLTLKTQRPMIPSADFQWFVRYGQSIYPILKPIKLS